MMKKYNKLMKQRIIALLMSLVMAVTLLPVTAFATATDTSAESTVQEESVSEENVSEEPSLEDTLILESDLSEENAVLEESTENSTVFDLGDGKKTVVYYSQDVRFEEDGELVDYDPSLVKIEETESESGESLEAYKYENKVGDSRHYIPEKLNEDSQILMEKGDYAIKMLPLDSEIQEKEVILKKEETLTPYETIEEKKTIAVYEAKDETYSYEYTSLNQGIKESIILNEKPASNIFTFSLELTGMYAELNEEENTILLKEEQEEEILAVIDRPFMNDATGEAYSEDLIYSLEEQADGTYLVTLTVSKKYLNSTERVYPVTIDPTATWKGEEEFLDAYVLNGSYADTNFYDSDTRVMPVGVGSKGTYRTYFKLPNIKTNLADKYVDSAYLTVYETGKCDADQLVRLNRITESWTTSTLTWNNKPAYNTAAYSNQFTTTGTQYAAHKVAITATIRNFLNSKNYPNYGLVMRNVSDDPEYAEFYGSRCTVATYRPKVVITYYDKPTKASSIYTTRLTNGNYVRSNYIKKGNRIYANWAGINSHNLSAVQYKFIGINGTADPTSVSADAVDLASYRSTGSSEADGTNVGLSYSPSLPAGVYRLYIRGKDAAGMFGVARYMTVYVDGAAPTLTDVSITPETSENSVTGNPTPTISWNASDTYFSKVTVSVDGKTAKTVSTTAGAGTYTIPAGTINTSGAHTIKITAYDKAGRYASKALNYYVDVDAPPIEVETVPATSDSKVSSDQTPEVRWLSDDEDIARVEILLNGESKYITTDTSVTSYQFEEVDFPESGIYTITVKVADTLGNEASEDVKYYLNMDVPVFESLSITPKTSTEEPSGNSSPVLNWNILDTSLASVEYSLDGETYVKMTEKNAQGEEENLTSKTGSFVLPSDIWGENIGAFTIRVRAVDTEGNISNVQELIYHLGTSTDYIPKNLAVTESYGKHLISWSFDGFDSAKTAYDIHRGTAADFTPGESTLLAADIDAAKCLYIDSEILESGTYYYKIVVKDITGETAVQSGCSEAVSVENTITAEQFSNTLGQKSYLSYLDMGLPMGNISVEESSGNLIYSQSEFAISNAQLSYGLDRTYNSKISRTSMFGTGWLDSYHKEIYTSGTDIYYVDSDGSSYRFTLSNGSYSCVETKEYSLTVTDTGYEIVTKDDHVYKFNEAGQLIRESEPNGCEISYSYDLQGRLAFVISKEDNSSERKLALIYGEDSYLLQSVEDFAGTVYQYDYTGSQLTKVSIGEKGNVEEGVSYDYSYGETGLLESIYDGMDNLYSVTYNNGKVASLSYPDGEKFTLTYKDASTEVEKYTPDQKKIHKEVITFDTATGKLISFQDAKENVTSYEYESDRPYLISKTKSTKAYQTIDENNKVVFHETENVVETAYTYDDNENVTKEENSDGSVTTYTYNTSDDVIAEQIVKSGETLADTTYTYDENGNLLSSEDKIADTLEENTYESGNLITTVVSNTDVQEVAEEEVEAEEDTGEATESVQENAGTEEAEEDTGEAETSGEAGEVSVTEYEYDSQGNVIFESTEVGEVTSEAEILYDAMGRTVQTEENGIKTITEYDFLGRDVKTTTREADKADVIVTKVYNDNSVLVSESSNIGVSKNYVYDSRNRLIKTTTSGEDILTKVSQTVYGYEENVKVHDGRNTMTEAVAYKESVKDTAGTVISTTYTDALGRTIKEETGTVYTDYTYDASENSVISYEGNTVDDESLLSMTLYDEEGRSFAEITNPQVSDDSYVIGETTVVTYSSYDNKGNIESETDALGVAITYAYDEEGHLIATDIAENGTDITVSYHTLAGGQELVQVTDANGNVKKELTDASGATVQTMDMDIENGGSIHTTYEYDTLGRKVSETYSDGSYKEYTYEGTSDRVQTEMDYLSDGTAESGSLYLYDTWNRLTDILHNEGREIVSVYSYTYDVNGNILTESVSYDSETARVTSYEYDVEGRLVKTTYPTQSALGVVEYEYDSYGKLTEILQDNEEIRCYYYDDFNRVVTVKDYEKPGSSSYILKSYEYDEFGRCVSAVYTENGNSQKVLESYAYSYDKNDNIISETRISNLPAEDSIINETRDYIYDSYGRLTQSTITDHTAEDVQVATTYEYDAVGNRVKMTEAGSETTYDYNGFNQLVKAESEEAEIVYTYDERGNQIKEKNETTGESNQTTYNVAGQMTQFVKIGSTTILTQTNVYDHSGKRISRKQDGTEREYYYNNGVVVYTEDDELLSTANIQNEDGSVIGTYRDEVYYNYLKNMQGSTMSIIDEDGEAMVVYSYSDFGETEEVVADTIDNEICYTGAIYDKDTGLYYMNARYYDAATGRFISQDSYRGEIEDVGTWHLYAYCSNNPINYVDLNGHKWLSFQQIQNSVKKDKKAKKVMERYYANVNRAKEKSSYSGNTTNVINYQPKLSHIKYRSTNVAKTGCAIIALHNILKLKGKGKNFIKLVAEFDYYMSSDGTVGIVPNTLAHIMSKYLNYSAYTKLDKFENDMTTSKYGIMLYGYKWGMHYVAMRKIKTKNENKKVYVLNLYGTSSSGKYYKSISNILDSQEGKFSRGYIMK